MIVTRLGYIVLLLYQNVNYYHYYWFVYNWHGNYSILVIYHIYTKLSFYGSVSHEWIVVLYYGNQIKIEINDTNAHQSWNNALFVTINNSCLCMCVCLTMTRKFFRWKCEYKGSNGLFEGCSSLIWALFFILVPIRKIQSNFSTHTFSLTNPNFIIFH